MSSISNNKVIAKNTVFLYARLVFTVLVGLYTSRIVLNALGVEDYGIYNLVGGFVSLLAIFTFSINGTCQRFIVFELGSGDKKKLSDTFCTITILLLLFSFLFFIVAGIIGSWFTGNILNVPEEKRVTAIVVYLCSLAVFCLQLLAIPYTSLVIAHERMDFYAVVSILETIAKLIIVLSIKYVEWNKLCYYAIALAIISLFVRITYGLYCKRNFVESEFNWIFKKDILKKIMSFTVWVGLGSFAGLLKDQGGNILINLFFGVTLNAACGIANQVRSHVSQFASNIGLAISPQITKSYSSGDTNRSIRLTFLLAKAQTMMLLFFVLPIILETPRLLHLWLGNVPNYAVSFTKIVLVLSVFQTLEMSYGPLFLAIGKVKKCQIIASSISLTVLPLSYLCYHFDMPPSSYYLVCITIETILFLYNFLFLSKIIGFPLGDFLKQVISRLIIVVLLPIVTCFIFYNLIEQLSYDLVKIVINIAICILSYGLSCYFWGLDKNERTTLINLVKSKIHI